MSKVHSGRWPTRCKVPGCICEKEFDSTSKLNTHLGKVHNINDADERATYYPLLQKKVFLPQGCVIDGCHSRDKYKAEKVFTTRSEAVHDTLQSCTRRSLVCTIT